MWPWLGAENANTEYLSGLQRARPPPDLDEENKAMFCRTLRCCFLKQAQSEISSQTGTMIFLLWLVMHGILCTGIGVWGDMVHSEKQRRPDELHPKVAAGRAATAEGTRVDMWCQSGGATAGRATVLLALSSRTPPYRHQHRHTHTHTHLGDMVMLLA